MKKIYLFVASITLGTVSFGQINHSFMTEKPGKKMMKATDVVKNDQPVAIEKAGGAVLFTETFGATLGTFTTTGVNASVWARDVNGPNGQFSSTSQKLVSPTSTTGFAIFDADLFNTPSGTDGSNYVAISGNLESPVIDLSTVPGAVLSFYNRYRTCCSSTFYPKIEVTTDGFTTVQEYDVTIDNVSVNDDSGNKKTTINLSSYLTTATNKNNFQFRFVWNSESTYFWQVDDISITEAYTYDLGLEKLWLTDIMSGYEQTDIPQALAGNLTVQAKIKNNGTTIPTNTQLIVKVYNAANALQSTQTGGVLLNNFTRDYDTITFATPIDLSALAIGGYYVKAEIDFTETDADAANDTIRRIFNVTDFYLGQKVHESAVLVGSVADDAADVANTPLAMSIGNVMYIPTDINLDGIEVTFGKATGYSTTVGEELTVEVFEIDPSISTFQDQFISTNEFRYFTITSAMLPTTNGNKSTVLDFHKSTGSAGNVALTGGKYYMVSVTHNGGLGKHLAYGYNKGDDDYSSRLFGEYGSTAGARWFVMGDQILTRMVFNPSLGVEEKSSTVASFGNLYPNPTNGQTSIAYSLENPSNVSVKVMDITGKVVYSSNEGTQTEGAHKVTVDASSYTTGVYYVTVSTNDSQVTKKLIKK